MSNRRRIRRQTIHIGPSPRDKVIAGLGAAGVVVFTALAVWALRPGGPHPRFGHGLTGGIAHRQSKVTLLVAITVIVLASLLSYAYSRVQQGRPLRRSGLIAATAVVLVAAVGAGFAWPGGLLYHWDPPVLPDDLPVPEDTVPLPQQTTVPEGSTTAPESTAAPTSVPDPSVTTTAAETSDG